MALAAETLCGSSSGKMAGGERVSVNQRVPSPEGRGGESGDGFRGWPGGNRMVRPSDSARPGTSAGGGPSRKTREGDGEDGGYLTLKVVRPSQEEGEGIEIHFRVKQTTQASLPFLSLVCNTCASLFIQADVCFACSLKS